jgi:hypothetical protein
MRDLNGLHSVVCLTIVMYMKPTTQQMLNDTNKTISIVSLSVVFIPHVSTSRIR